MPKSVNTSKRSKSGGSRKAPSPTFAASSSSSGDFLSKLTLLREFITGCGAGHQYSERDLSACLRRSGLNVEAAAEQLLTGQWKSEDSPTNGSGVFSFEASSAPPSASASASASAPVSSKPSSASGSAGRRKVTPSPPDSSKRRRISGNSSRNSGKSAAKASSSLTTTSSSGKSLPAQPQQHLLLCRRWMVGLSTSRGGRVRHGEKLHLTASSSGPPIVRFRGSNVEGTLPQEESSMLTPLLRHVCDGSKHPTNLISISAEALMEDTGLVIGSEVPLSLSVYIDQPAQFFDLFSAATSAADTKAGGNDWLSKKISSKKKQMPPVAAAAFRLLQWAQYGNVPSFRPANNADGSSGDSYKEDGDSGSSSDDVDGNDNDCEGATFVDEEQFSQPDEEENAPDWANSIIDNIGAGDSQEGPSKTSTSMELGAQLPEESDPGGLRSDITLRPYQRQALHWMLKREDDSPDRNDLTKEMELLAELASTSGTAAAAGGSAPSSHLGGSKDITCDCGPVLVSEEMATKSVTIYGDLDPVQHPLWQRRFLTTDGFNSAVCFYVNEVLGVATSRPPNPPRQCVGGILADSMGLGKTVMLLSLIMKSKEKRIGTATSTDKIIKRRPTDDSRNEQSDGPNETIDILSSDDESDNDDADDEDYKPTSDGRRKPVSLEMKSARSDNHTTLVVAPLSLVLQWEEEISTKTDLSCLVYYGDTRAGTSSRSFRGVDVVLTTYGTLQTEYLQSTSSSPKEVKPTTLLSHQWERVIVDEAHQIKNPSTAVSKSCCSVIAAKRWAVTGTPIQNSLQDVFGLMKFLKHEPWCNHAFWKTAITTTEPTPDGTGPGIAESTSEHHGMSLAMDRVRRILHPLILRRTKETIGADGKPILTLPPIDSRVVSVHLTEAEREFYTALLDKSQHVFEGLLKAGTASKSWLAIFSLLQRLRQSCDHVALTVKPRFTDSGSAASASETSDEQEGSTSDETAVNRSFLSNLLQMFAKQANKSNGDQQPAPSSPSKSPGKTTQTGEPSSAFISQVVQSLTESVDEGGKIKEECPLCLDCPDISSAVLTPCAHTMCLDCLRPVLKQSASTRKQDETSTPQCQNALSLKDGPCPVCNAQVEASRIVSFSKSEETGDVTFQFVGDIPMPEGADSLVNVNMDPTAASARETLLASLSGGDSSKLAAVKRELHEIWKLDRGSKVLIFSQYLGFLDILGIFLRKEGIPVFRLDGQMSLKDRVAALDRFNKAKSTSTRCTGDAEEEEIIRGSVFLASMKAGGVGINLVAASSVFIVDPWWNSAIEDQCINRIHRIGQKAPIVRVRKFVVNDSVEDKIVRLQQTKKSMATNILDANGDGTDASSGSKPTLDDFKILLGR